MKVFISSTYVDLKEYRQRAIEVVNKYECTPLAMELFGSQPEEPKKVCADKIEECDIFIGIYAHRYGFIPKGETKSITQLEYELAKTEGKDCLCFIVNEDFDWKPRFIEHEKTQALTDFLNTVREGDVVSTFTDCSNFEIILAISLGKLIAKKKGTKIPKDSTILIPRAPYPYMAHPYALPEHFTGRRAEMAMLSNWFFNDKEPMLVLEAIGGMGKSALSWAWLHQEIMEKAVKVDGIFWWSFYDDPFESFISQLYCYVTGKETAQEIQMGELLAALNQRRFLLVLDGFERALRGYAGMEAMFIQEKRFEGETYAEVEWDKRQREPVELKTGRFLEALCGGNTKTLMTTRLTPVSLEGIAGVKHLSLKGLSPEDTVSFFRSEGINGTRAEMEQAGNVYDFHPLMLKLLASSIKRSQKKDINEAFSENLINCTEPHKILDKSLHLLSEEERWVATRVAVFRGVFSFDAAKALTTEMEEKRLWEVMQELRNLGFLFYDEIRDRFDFHPILRSYLYGQLTSSGGTGVHDLAAQYFQALPKPQKVVTLEDLAPVIELYHHLVKARKYDEAIKLFRDRIRDVAYYQLAAYHLIIDLLKGLSSGGECDGRFPLLLKVESDQSYTLNELANSYVLSGQPSKAVPLSLKSIFPDDETNDKMGVSISQGSSAIMAQIYIGQFSAGTVHLRKRVDFCIMIKDEFREALGHQYLGRVLAFQGRVADSLNPPLIGCANVEEEFDKAFDLAGKVNQIHYQGLTSAYRSLSALFQARLATVLCVPMGKGNHSSKLSLEALHHARRALTFAKAHAEIRYPHPRDFVRAYWLLGEAIIQRSMDRTSNANNIEPFTFDIPFYDAYFQQIVETVTVMSYAGSELKAADRSLYEALCRCRKANMIPYEADILLAMARLDVAQNNPPDETLLKEAFEIALRSGYRLKLADLHLFCGQILLQFKDMKSLLGHTAVEHLQKTKEYALDVSKFSDLYSPVKTTADEFYKDIPEYDMLKRGMTNEERIQNGYWVAYQIAETLLNQCPQNTRTGEDTEL